MIFLRFRDKKWAVIHLELENRKKIRETYARYSQRKVLGLYYLLKNLAGRWITQDRVWNLFIT